MLAVRSATAADAATILRFVVLLAEYEREPSAVRVTADDLAAQLAEPSPPFQCLIAEVDGAPVGFALYFPTYSTWRGKTGTWLEDLFVLPEHRGSGVGRALLARVAEVTVTRGGARLEWAVLRWNEPAIRFYEQLGASPLDAWETYRLTDEQLSKLARRG